MKSKEYRLAQMQLRNIVNIGIENGIPLTDIRLLAMATIDASQLFMDDKEISELRIDLYNRLKSVAIYS
ncbi:hypothetical protein X915_gp012 [Bacillus phage vB_BanS-Tsamsa]|uniref:Uncharacterized protein n=1 Tax=Bacillus phage vB_BanS-Tsamsa TaxID=1308863 RepID=U5J9L0_9CAUD|nr:hypothetical protein X915_gp012 [Bacillus phage vB_BanS-Tsamsa]AGI11938.1 hypothetical protein [Bacillus phage vB_BanS-Tsamsa]